MNRNDFAIIYDRFKTSGLSESHFCENECYSKSSFYYWMRKFLSQKSSHGLRPITITTPEKTQLIPNRVLYPRLKQYITDGTLLIDNNGAENVIRPVAVSRKNFLFCGNHQAAENASVIFTLMGCCKEAGINPREWLIDVITKMPYFLRYKNKLEDLLPAIWAKKH